MTPACIGLGANLGDAVSTLKSAVAALRTLADSRVVALSCLYRSAPVGPAGQPDYLNAALQLDTTLTPHALLSALQAIENEHGRVREVRWGARTLDLDLLLFGRDEIVSADLTVPHTELTARNFVVCPLLDIDAGLSLPDGRLLASLPAARDGNGLVAIADRHWAD
ncbi:MAG: 2-amino-4-hydroxy-6-hydroxymethyldihydropteridine diphosphokinase [Pedobacter sp.]|nr:2-amino-4-hydroxy-6-hydroxymethyldihydropteridine diphosphokinase [Pedobacter sp.]